MDQSDLTPLEKKILREVGQDRYNQVIDTSQLGSGGTIGCNRKDLLALTDKDKTRALALVKEALTELCSKGLLEFNAKQNRNIYLITAEGFRLSDSLDEEEIDRVSTSLKSELYEVVKKLNLNEDKFNHSVFDEVVQLGIESYKNKYNLE